MAGSSVNLKGNSLSHHAENKPGGQLSDRVTITRINGSAYFDKETLRQTMLVHEAAFQKQVHELHCLYKVQKDLMALQCRREEFNGYSRFADTLQAGSYSSQAPSGDVRRVWQVGPHSGHDIKQPPEKIMKGNGLEYSLKGVPLRHSNSRPTQKMLELQPPADAYADDSDDDVQILEENPAKSFPRTNGSLLGRNVKLNLESSSHVESLITGLQPSHGSTVNVSNKQVGESSNTMKITNFPCVGTSTSQNWRYSSARANLNLLSLEDKLEEKCFGEASVPKFFGANKEMRLNNSYSRKREDQSNNMSWFKNKQNGVDSSRRCYLSSSSTFNPQILVVPSSNAGFESLWQSNTTDYTTKRHHSGVGIPVGQNGFSIDFVHTPTFQQYCRHYHSSKIPEGAQYQKHSPFRDYPKDVNLNDGSRDVTTTLEQGCENTPMDISWIRKKLVNMMKWRVPSSCANGHSQILPGSTTYSEGSTRILGFPISAATKNDSQCSSTLHVSTNNTLLTKGAANMEMQFQNQKDGTNAMSLIDLNVALPFMHDQEMDARQSEGDAVPQESDDPSNESPAIIAAKNLLAMCDDMFQAGSPRVDILHWFADLATSENTKVYSSESNNGDGSEALTQEIKDNGYNSKPLTQEEKSNENHGPAAA